MIRPDHTHHAVTAVYKDLRERGDHPCLVIPSCDVKTSIIATICRDAAIHLNRRVLIVSGHSELLQHAADALLQNFVDVRIGVYSDRLDRHEARAAVVMGDIETVHQRARELGPFGLILVDDAHMVLPENDDLYRRFLAETTNINPGVRVIGFAPTMFRIDSEIICGPENILNHFCGQVALPALIQDGHLSQIITKASITRVNTSGVRIVNGDFDAGDVETLLDNDGLVHAACREIVDSTLDRRSVLICATGVHHGRHVQHVLQQQHGVGCGFISRETPAGERKQILRAFREGTLKYLCHVNVLAASFNAPGVDCVVLMRPTMSSGIYYQMVECGLHLAAGKLNCLVLDFAGNALRHGPLDALRMDACKHGVVAAKECPDCRAVIGLIHTTCPQCAHQFPVIPRYRNSQGGYLLVCGLRQ